MKTYNEENIPLAKALRKNMTPWERKLLTEISAAYARMLIVWCGLLSLSQLR